MGLLDSLNPINLAKSAAESIVDSVLPDSLKAVGNDLVDVALDVVGGNYGALGKDVGSFLHDSETAMAPLTNLATSLPSAATEPDAPPAADSTKTSGAKSSASQSPATSSSTKSANAPSPDTAATGTGSSTGTAETTGTADSTGEAALSTTSAVSDGDGSTTTSAAATDGKSKSKSKSTSTSSSSKSKSTSSSSKSSSSSDAKDVTKFFAQSDTDLMAAVRDGKLPDAVKDDPAAMQRLQLRMNEISEMNQLISQMLAAMHDMNKAVIQNIRA